METGYSHLDDIYIQLKFSTSDGETQVSEGATGNDSGKNDASTKRSSASRGCGRFSQRLDSCLQVAPVKSGVPIGWSVSVPKLGSGFFGRNADLPHLSYSTMSNDAAPSGTVPRKRSLDVPPGSNNTRQRLVKVTRACDVCKARKSKCSGDQPCETCTRRGLTCQYEAAYSRGKVVSPRPVHPAAVNAQQPASAPAYPHAILSVAPTMNVVGEETEPPSRASPGLEVAGQYSDSTSGLSFLNRAWRRISNKETSLVNGLGSTEDRQLLMSAGDKPFLETGEVQMPSLDRSRQLLHLYFDVCIATYRLLHRPTVEAWLETVSDNAKQHRALFHGMYDCNSRDKNISLTSHVDIGLGRAKTSAVLSALAISTLR